MKRIWIGFIACFLLITGFSSCKNEQTVYVCAPCNLPCDSLTFSSAGECPHCHMQLIKQDDVSEKEAKHLVIFIGELDNENEKGGTLLRSPSADQQGRHRLERGIFFYNEAKTKADATDADFHWELRIIPNVGHNQRGMGEAAAQYLYDNEN